MCHGGSLMVHEWFFCMLFACVASPCVVGGCGLGVQAAKTFGGLDAGRAEHSE